MASGLSSQTAERQAASLASVSPTRERRTGKGHTDRNVELPASAMNKETYNPFRGQNEPPQPWSVENVFRLGADHDQPPTVAQPSQKITLNGLSHLFSTPKIRRL